MNLEDKIKAKIKELQSFVDKQAKDAKEIEVEVQKGINAVPDESIRNKMGAMLREAKKGKIQNVQRLAKILTEEAQKLNNKES